MPQAEPYGSGGSGEAVGFPLPLYTEEWVEELLSRVFAILSNLETPHQADSGERLSFLLEGNSMFRCASAGFQPQEVLNVGLPTGLQRRSGAPGAGPAPGALLCCSSSAVCRHQGVRK